MPTRAHVADVAEDEDAREVCDNWARRVPQYDVVQSNSVGLSATFGKAEPHEFAISTSSLNLTFSLCLCSYLCALRQTCSLETPTMSAPPQRKRGRRREKPRFPVPDGIALQSSRSPRRSPRAPSRAYRRSSLSTRSVRVSPRASRSASSAHPAVRRLDVVSAYALV